MPRGKRQSSADPSSSSTSSTVAAPTALSVDSIYGGKKFKVARVMSPLAAEFDGRDAPGDIADLFAWEVWMMDRLFDPAVSTGAAIRRWRFKDILDRGVRMHSDHSGLGTAEMVAHRVRAESVKRGWGREDCISCHRACDCKPSSLHLLQHFGEQSADHIQVNVLDSLQIEIRQRLHAMEPDESWSDQRKQAAYKAIYAVMNEAYEKKVLFNMGAAAHCVRHNRMCPGFDLKANGVTMSIHGTACTAWSAAGKQQGTCHPSIVPWFCFVFYVLTFEPTIAIHEITELHPDEVFTFHFADKFDIVSLHINPHQLGFPIRRPRRYRILVNKKKAVMVGSAQDFFNILECRPKLPAESMCCADEEMLGDKFMKVARSRHRIPQEAPDLGTLPWEQMLTPAELGRLRAHRQQSKGTPLEGCFFADISKTDEFMRASEYIPTLVQNSKVWCEKLGREVLPIEHLVFQGFPALPQVARQAALPWADSLGCPPEGVSEGELRSLAGNAMHLGVLGAVVLYALSTIQISDGPMRFHRMASLLEMPTMEDPPPGAFGSALEPQDTLPDSQASCLDWPQEVDNE